MTGYTFLGMLGDAGFGPDLLVMARSGILGSFPGSVAFPICEIDWQSVLFAGAYFRRVFCALGAVKDWSASGRGCQQKLRARTVHTTIPDLVELFFWKTDVLPGYS